MLGWFWSAIWLIGAAIFGFIAALIVLDATRDLEGTLQKSLGDLVFGVAAVLLFVGFAALLGGLVLGTGGLTIDRASGTIVRWRGLVFIPLSRDTHSIAAETHVMVLPHTHRTRAGTRDVHVVHVEGHGYSIALNEHHSFDDANAQAETIRSYLAAV